MCDAEGGAGRGGAGSADGVTWDDPFLDALEPVLAKYRASKERSEAQNFIKALRLAGPSLEVMEALCRGEKVHRSRLEQGWAKRYGLIT